MQTVLREKKKHGFGWKRAAIISAAIVVLSGAAFLFFSKGNKVGVSIQINGPVRLGEAFDIEVIANNESKETLRDVSLSLTLPDGVSFFDGASARRVKKIGVIEEGGSSKEIFRAIVNEDKEGDEILRAEVDYTPKSLGREMKAFSEIPMKTEKWLTLSIDTPEKVVSGEEFQWAVSYKNNSDKEWKIKLQAELPEGFDTDFKESEITILPKDEGKKDFSGKIVMEEGSSFDIRMSAKGVIGDKEQEIDYAKTQVLIASSPLSIKISTKDDKNEAAAGDKIEYEITVRNSTDVPMKNVTLRSVFKGDMINADDIESTGEAAGNVIVWNKDNAADLKEIAPGSSVSFPVVLPVLSSFPIRKLSDRNFVVRMDVRVESPTVPSLSKSLKTVNIASKEIKIIGKLDANTAVLFRDAKSGIINEGDLPFEKGVPTEVTVHWKLSDYGNDMENVEISAKLPSGVTLTDNKKADAGEISYVAEDRKMVWKIPKVLATSGILSKPITAVFQLRVTPPASSVGGFAPILEETSITATDMFTGSKYQGYDAAVDSSLKDDPTITPTDGIVR